MGDDSRGSSRDQSLEHGAWGHCNLTIDPPPPPRYYHSETAQCVSGSGPGLEWPHGGDSVYVERLELKDVCSHKCPPALRPLRWTRRGGGGGAVAVMAVVVMGTRTAQAVKSQ